MDKIAIHVPHQFLSEAVQKYLFSKGYEWVDGGEGIAHLTAPYLFRYKSNKEITFSRYTSDDDTILTVDEFFAREAEKPPPVSIFVTANGVKVKPFTRFDYKDGFILEYGKNTRVTFTWKDYDEIGKLRPKEGV